MYLNEQQFIELNRAREQQLARELEFRRVMRERMLEEGLPGDSTAPIPRRRIRWRGTHSPGHA